MASSDRDALVALYNTTDGANWTNNKNWNTNAPLSDWYGVNEVNGRVVKLNLFSNKLQGPIPPELGKLAALVELVLWSNQLSSPIPSELGHLSALKELYLANNQLSGSIPPELGKLAALTTLDLRFNKLSGNPGSLEGAGLTRWLEQLRGSRPNRPWAMSGVDFLIALWHFLIPIFDDVTDVILLVATFEDRGALWWACVGAFVVADVERVVLLLVALCLLLCWIPFALVDRHSREELFHVPLKVLNGWHHLQLEENNDDTTPSRSALRWPIFDAVTWAVVGSRSKSSSLMRLCGLQGDTPIDTLERSGFGLSLIDKIVKYHPYSIFGGAIFSCPHGHRLPGDDTATRRSGVMLRAVGETLVVDSLFLALSLSSEPWEEGVSIGVYSLIFSVLELLTELQYYAAEAEAGMTMGEEEPTVSSIEEPIQRAPAV